MPYDYYYYKSKECLRLNIVEDVLLRAAVAPLAVAGLALPLLQVVSWRVEAHLDLHGLRLAEGEFS